MTDTKQHTWEEAATLCPQCGASEQPHRHTVAMASLYADQIPRTVAKKAPTGRKRGRPRKRR